MNKITDINPFLGIEFCAINKVPSVTLKFDWTIENYDLENKGVCKSPDIELPDVTLAFVWQRVFGPDSSDGCDFLFVKSNSDKIHLSGIVVLHEKKFEFDRKIDNSKEKVFLRITKVPNKSPRSGQPIPVKALFDVKVCYLDKKNYTFTQKKYGMSILEVDQYRQELQNNVQEMWRNSLFSDVQILTGNKSVSAHKNILSARSPVFASMFQHSTITKYAFDDVPFDTLEPFLGYFYGQIPNFEEIQDVNKLCELYHLSDKYKVLSLRDMCGQALFSKMTAENVLLLLDHFKRHRDDEFVKECIKFCSKQLNSVESEELRRVILNNPEFLSLVLKEMTEPKFRAFHV